MRRVAAAVLATLALATATTAASSLPLADAPFSQVIADRYLFRSQSSICQEWPQIDVASARVVTAAPSSFGARASTGAWIIAGDDAGGSVTQRLFWFDTAAGNLTPTLRDDAQPMDCTVLVPVEATVAGVLISLIALCASVNAPANESEIRLISCQANDPTNCKDEARIMLEATGITSALYVDATTNDTASTLWIGSDSGLHSLNLATFSLDYNAGNITEPVSSLAYAAKYATLFAGTPNHLYIQDGSAFGQGNWRQEEVTALIDSPIVALTYDSIGNQLWISYVEGITLYTPLPTPMPVTGEIVWVFNRLAGFVSNPGSDIGGLPHHNVTVLATEPTDGGRVWLGGLRGLMRFDANAENPADRWRVFSGPRYMPINDMWAEISSMTVLPSVHGSLDSTAIAIARSGLAVVRFEKWTLEKKAAYMQTYMAREGRHHRYGLVGACYTKQFGSTETCEKDFNDNDGLWTSIYLASQVWRYGVTKDPSVREEAWAHFEAMQSMQTLTNVYGYPARSIAKLSDFPTGGAWHPSETRPGWQFKGDTSSDEISGHQYIYPIVWDILAETDEEKRAAAFTFLNITNNIVANNLTLVGESGKHTKWGVWSPATINEDPLWQEGRGPNSLQILAFIQNALAMGAESGNLTAYTDALEYLLSTPVRYDLNLVNAKMIAVCDSDFSDDELNYINYFTMAHAFRIARRTIRRLKREQRADTSSVDFVRWLDVIARLEAYMLVGLNQAHAYKRGEKSSFYNSIYCYASGQVASAQELEEEEEATPGLRDIDRTYDCGSLTADSVWYLRRWPLEQYNWPVNNTDRLDVTFNDPAYGCRAGDQSYQLLPPDERDIHKWNQGPFALEGGDGLSEEGVGPFLNGYWLMRFYGLLQ